MKKYYCFCVFIISLLFFSNNSYGHNDFKSGYIINNSLDTVFGLLNNKANSINSSRCEFKKVITDATIIYYPFDINSYVLANNRHYVSKTITINGEERHVFLEFLVNGVIDLYYFNEGLEEFFFIEKDGELFQLNNNAIEVIGENEAKYIRYSQQYKGVLKKLFGNVTELDGKIINSKFQLASLINITKEYHRMVCTDEVCIDYTKMKKWDIFCEVISGADFSFMGLASSHDYAKDLKPLFGLNIRLKDNRYNSKLNIITGINVSKHSFSGGFRNTLIFPQRKMSHGVDLDCTLLRIPITLEYVFLSGKLKPTISVSYNNTFLLDPKYYVEIRNYSIAGSYISTPIESPLRRYEYGLMLGSGFSYEINHNSYLTFNISGEYRVPYVSFNYMLDRLHFTSLLFHIGYGFRISKL